MNLLGAVPDRAFGASCRSGGEPARNRRRGWRQLAPLLLLVAAAGCSGTAPADPQYVQPANLLEIVKEFQRISREDIYRFEIPKDVTGSNILKATLLRLDDFETKHPGTYNDIVAFTRAQAYERLRAYPEALRHYQEVTQYGGELGAKAREHIEALELFQQVRNTPLPATNPFDYIKALDQKVAAWNALIEKYRGSPLEFLARLEEERVDRAKVAFVELNRYRLKDGNRLVVVGYGQLLSKHSQSKNYYRYLLDFGDYYVELAKEYAIQNDPEGLDFELETFEEFAKSAMNLYTEVAQQDGILEKVEAQGKLDSLKGLMDKMRRLNR